MDSMKRPGRDVIAHYGNYQQDDDFFTHVETMVKAIAHID
jgi:hypothetical protein